MNRLFSIILLIAAAYGSAFVQAGDPVSVRASVNPSQTLQAGRDLELSIVVTFSDSFHVDEVVWPDQWGRWEVVESSFSDQQTSNPGETSRTIRALLRPQELGRLCVPPVPVFYSIVSPQDSLNVVKVADSDGKAGQGGTYRQNQQARQMVQTPMFTIDVESKVNPDDLSLKSLESKNNLISNGRSWSFWVVVILASVIVAGLIWSVLRSYRRPKPTVPAETPQEWATRQLQKLLESGLNRTDVKLFYIQLTDIIRTFIERTTLINAPELTTEEFLRRISQGNIFSDVERFKLKAFLEQADMVKFARYEPQDDLIRQSVQAAELFIGIEREDG